MEQKNLKDYIDAWNLVCVRYGPGSFDGGDTCANEFTILYARHAKRKLISTDEALEIAHKLKAVHDAPSNLYVRHPDPNMWYSDLDRFSRDQMTPLLLFLGLCLNVKAAKEHLSNLFRAHAKRLFLFAWNTRHNYVYMDKEEHARKANDGLQSWNPKWKLPDITGPSIWASWIRIGLKLLPRGVRTVAQLLAQPVLSVLDLELLVGAVVKRAEYANRTEGRDWRCDWRNHALLSHYSRNNTPTLVSIAAHALVPNSEYLYAFRAFWALDPSEPPIDQHIGKLYK